MLIRTYDTERVRYSGDPSGRLDGPLRWARVPDGAVVPDGVHVVTVRGLSELDELRALASTPDGAEVLDVRTRVMAGRVAAAKAALVSIDPPLPDGVRLDGLALHLLGDYVLSGGAPDEDPTGSRG